VVYIIDLDSVFREFINFHISLLFSGSRPVVGSSKIIIFGFPIVHKAILTLLLIPPDKLAIFVFREDSKFTFRIRLAANSYSSLVF